MTAAVADNATTVLCFTRLGEAVAEVNPFSAFLMENWGVETTMIANALWSCVFVVWLAQLAQSRRSRFALVIMILIILTRGYAAVHNLGIAFTAL